MTRSAFRNDNCLHLMANLKKCLKEDVILMIVSNQHVIDRIGQIEIRVTGDVTLICITQNRIEQQAYPTHFEKNASVTKIPPSRSASRVRRIRTRGLRSQKRF